MDTTPAYSAEQLALRYLRAFGPASAADMRAWSGLAMRGVFERLRPTLKTFRSEEGAELFDLPRAPRPAGETPAPIRLLPDYDNILLGHSDRSRIMPTGRHAGMFSSNGIMQGSVLVDGFVRAVWRPSGDVITITPFAKPIPRLERAAIEEEASRLQDFLAPGNRHGVRFGPVQP